MGSLLESGGAGNCPAYLLHEETEMNKILTTILGSTFDWRDLIAYTIGIGVTLFLENVFSSQLES